MDYKQALRNSIVISLCFIVGYYVVFGSRGMMEYFKTKRLITKTQQKNVHLEKNIHDLKRSIVAYQKNPFEMEKVARYDFDMGRTNEMVYLLPKA